MNKTISPSPITGTIPAIASKSDAHRRLICAALAKEPSLLELSTTSRDIEATIDCLKALGARIDRQGTQVRITPGAKPPAPELDCGESGSTLRFLLPVAAALGGETSFIGHGRLPQRPLEDLKRVMMAGGISFSAETLPFTISGKLKAGDYSLPGNVSSQYITGLMLALPLLEGDSRIVLTTPLESRGYVDMTISALKAFGVTIEATSTGWNIPGDQTFTGSSAQVEGDWSNAAFWLCAGAISGPVTVTGLAQDSCQGDKAVLDILRRFGAHVTVTENAVTVAPASLTGCEIDVSDIPDLLPVLAVTAACAQGETRFTGAARLRLKESDRLTTTAAMLNALGAHAQELPDGLVVSGSLTGGTVDGAGDHRIVMSAAIASGRCSIPVTITGAEAADKSYPDFWNDLQKMTRS